jgi:hypothetical protein
MWRAVLRRDAKRETKMSDSGSTPPDPLVQQLADQLAEIAPHDTGTIAAAEKILAELPALLKAIESAVLGRKAS